MITSRGSPATLERAKRTIYGALIGLVVIMSATTLVTLLRSTYETKTENNALSPMPIINPLTPVEPPNGLVDVLVQTTIGFLRACVETVAQPFLTALTHFTNETPLMADNSSVFTLWSVLLAIANILLILVVILIGFHVMSAASLGFEDVDLAKYAPQLIATFIVMNSSLFLIDLVIGISNNMIDALQAGVGSSTVWQSLQDVITHGSTSMQLASLLLMATFIILSVILLIYYILRVVTLYIGAVLSPLVVMLWILPGFRDFATGAMRSYATTIFVLFIHVVILTLSASLLSGMNTQNESSTLDPTMSMLVGIATLLALLKTQSVISQLALVSYGARTSRKLGGEFMNGVSALTMHRHRRPMVAPTPPTLRSPTIVRIPPKGESL